MIQNTLHLLLIVAPFLLRSAIILDNTSSYHHKDEKSGKIHITKAVLDNGIKVLVISDPKTSQSSIAIGFGRGSWDDPTEYPGTAHFCEHMVFLGSDEYPEEDAIMNYAAAHNGKVNAYTGPTETVYSFSCSSPAFIEGSKIFASMFTSPLFLQESKERECKAVDSEFKKNLPILGNRIYSINKETSNPNHPHSCFSCGNYETIGAIPVETLRNWQIQNYNSNEATIAIHTNLTGEATLQAIEPLFSALTPCEDLTRTKEPLFSETQFTSTIYVEPLHTNRAVMFYFELPEPFQNDEGLSALEVVKRIVNDRSENSFFSRVKNEYGVSDINFDILRFSKDKTVAIFSFAAESLTQEDTQKIKSLYYSFFSSLESIEIPDYFVDEIQKKTALYLTQKDMPEGFKTVTNIASDLQMYPLESYPNEKINITHSQTTLRELCGFLKSNSVVTFVVSSDIDPSMYTLKEKWSAAPYGIVKNESTITIKNIVFDFPDVNVYLPHSLEYAPSTKSSIETVYETSHSKIQLVRNTQYDGPNSIVITSIAGYPKPKTARSTATAITLMHMYLDATEDLHQKLVSAGFDTSISITTDGMDIMCNGYNETFKKALPKIIHTLKNTPLNIDAFEKSRAHALEECFESFHSLLIQQAITALKAYISDTHFTTEETILALEEITLSDIKALHASIFDSLHLHVLASGTISKESLVETVKTIIQTEEIQHKNGIALTSSFRVFTSESDITDGAATIVVIQEPQTPLENVVFSLITPHLNQSYFTELRTNQQVGYIVGGTGKTIENEGFNILYAQSPHVSGNDLFLRTVVFLKEYIDDIEDEITENDFRELRLSAIHDTMYNEISHEEHAMYMSQLLIDGDSCIVPKDDRLEILESLTYEKFISIVKKIASTDKLEKHAIIFQGKQ